MKLLAIGDLYIPAEFMEAGYRELADAGVEVVVRQWRHETLADLQKDNLAVEQGGPEAVKLPDELIHDVADNDIISGQFPPIGRDVIDAATRLKVLAVLRGGVENVAADYAAAKGIAVFNTPGRNARAVAEFSLGVILGEIRNVARAHAALKQATWRKDFPNSEYIPELYGKTVGLVGYGAVGRLAAGYLQAFGSRIVAYDPYFQGDPAPAELVGLPALLRASDVVSIHARLTEESHHLIGEAELAMMKPSAVLVNTARSGLVDEQALIGALKAGAIKGAAVDVFDVEPLPPDHPFLQLDNVTLTPHLAGSTKDAFANSPKLMAGHLMRLFQGETDLPIVNGVAPPDLRL